MMRNEYSFPPMLLVVAITVIAAGVFHLNLGWVVLIASPLAIFLAWKKAKQA